MSETILSVRGLYHSFSGLSAVSDFNAEIRPDAVLGIIGPNGAGKTTIFNLISGVYKPDAGTVNLNNEKLTGLSPHTIAAKGVARTFQNIRLFKSMSVLDNVITAGYCRPGYSALHAFCHSPRFLVAESKLQAEAMELLELFGIAGRAHEPAASLPYGLQRKVEFARALFNKPKALMLDEPGAGMNPTELEGLIDLVRQVRQRFGVAVALIEHRMRLVSQLCDRVIVLNFGKTLFVGKPHELADNEEVVKAYFGENHAAAFD